MLVRADPSPLKKEAVTFPNAFIFSDTVALVASKSPVLILFAERLEEVTSLLNVTLPVNT